MVSENGVETDTKKTAAIRDWPVPIIVTDVKIFLSYTNYYRRFIKDYAKVAHPLYALISRDNASKKNKAVVWTQGCQQAFDKLKDCCTSAPILAYADFSEPFKLHTDVSSQGLGTVLYHEVKGKGRVISCASTTLNKGEKKYAAHTLEFLVLK